MRPGTLEVSEIRKVLEESEKYKNLKVTVKKQNKSVEEEEKTVAPGQLLKHYSPNVDCFLLQDFVEGEKYENKENLELKNCAIIDFNGHYLEYKEHVLLYRDLSSKGCYKEALFNLYLLLRESEIVEGIQAIFVKFSEIGFEEGSFGSTLNDKIYRSAAGIKSAIDSTGSILLKDQ